MVQIDQFYVDAAAGNAPRIQPGRAQLRRAVRREPPGHPFGDEFVGKVVNAVMSSPNGQDHADLDLRRTRRLLRPRPPPAAVPPDDVRTGPWPGDPPEGSTATASGSRVRWSAPTPKKNYVSHTVYDHTSILKTVEEKWNLPALTRRDANANSLFDMLDLHKKPAFLKPPKLPPPPNPAGRSLTTGRAPSPTIGRFQGLIKVNRTILGRHFISEATSEP